MSKYGKSKNDKANAKPASKKKSTLITLDSHIGGPPATGSNVYFTDRIRANSSLIVIIRPCSPEAQTGISLFTLKSEWKKYSSMLNSVGYSPSQTHVNNKGIVINCQADNFPSDTFSNEYGESFLNQITDVTAGGLGQLSQIMAQDKATKTIEEIGKLGKEAGSSIGGLTGSSLSGLSGGVEAFGQNADKVAKDWASKKGIQGTIGSTMNKLLAGARVDFPMIWKGSSYSPTFSCTIKLYNPNPGDAYATKKYILGPLAALMTLCLPVSEDNDFAYKYPFFCKVNCPGLFDIQEGAISSLTVVKGGDSGLVGFNQRVAMVDVRIDFINLHNTMLFSGGVIGSRPTLKGYLDNMIDTKKTEFIYDTTRFDKIVDNSSYSPGNIPRDASDITTPVTSRATPGLKETVNVLLSKFPGGWSID